MWRCFDRCTTTLPSWISRRSSLLYAWTGRLAQAGASLVRVTKWLEQVSMVLEACLLRQALREPRPAWSFSVKTWGFRRFQPNDLLGNLNTSISTIPIHIKISCAFISRAHSSRNIAKISSSLPKIFTSRIGLKRSTSSCSS